MREIKQDYTLNIQSSNLRTHEGHNDNLDTELVVWSWRRGLNDYLMNETRFLIEYSNYTLTSNRLFFNGSPSELTYNLRHMIDSGINQLNWLRVQGSSKSLCLYRVPLNFSTFPERESCELVLKVAMIVLMNLSWLGSWYCWLQRL